MTMNSRVDRRKFGVLLVAMIVALCFATGALARGGGRERSTVERPMKLVVENVDRARRTVTIGGEIYSVTDRTKLLDAAGKKIALGQLRGIRSHGRGDLVDFTFKRSGKHGKAELRELKVAAALIR